LSISHKEPVFKSAQKCTYPGYHTILFHAKWCNVPKSDNLTCCSVNVSSKNCRLAQSTDLYSTVQGHMWPGLHTVSQDMPPTTTL